MNKLLPIIVFSFILTTGISAPVFADFAGGWPAECGPQPQGGVVAHGPLTANPAGNSVTLNTVTTTTFPNDIFFVLDPGVGSSTQFFNFIPVSTPIVAQFNGLSPGPHTAVVCYETVVNTGHSDIVNFVISNSVVAGKIIPIESTNLLVAGLQISAIWLAPIVISAVGLGIVLVKRKF